MLSGHRLSALLKLHLRSQHNICFQWIGQRQLHDETRSIQVLGFGAPDIRDLSVIEYHKSMSAITYPVWLAYTNDWENDMNLIKIYDFIRDMQIIIWRQYFKTKYEFLLAFAKLIAPQWYFHLGIFFSNYSTDCLVMDQSKLVLPKHNFKWTLRLYWDDEI